MILLFLNKIYGWEDKKTIEQARKIYKVYTHHVQRRG